MKPFFTKEDFKRQLDLCLIRFPFMLIVITILLTMLVAGLLTWQKSGTTVDMFSPMVLSDAFFKGTIISIGMFYLVRIMMYKNFEKISEYEKVTEEMEETFFLPCLMGEYPGIMKVGTLQFTKTTYRFQPERQMAQELKFKGALGEDVIISTGKNSKNILLWLFIGKTEYLSIEQPKAMMKAHFIVPDAQAAYDRLIAWQSGNKEGN